MAYLTGTRKVYLFVSEEDNQTSISASEHSVEQGMDLTDHVRPDAESVSLRGIISGSNYKSIVSLIKKWEKAGRTVNYSGRTKLSQCLIDDFAPSYSKDIQDGCQFTMVLRKIRIARPAYVPATAAQPQEAKPAADAGMQSVEANNPEDQYRQYARHTERSMLRWFVRVWKVIPRHRSYSRRYSHRSRWTTTHCPQGQFQESVAPRQHRR